MRHRVWCYESDLTHGLDGMKNCLLACHQPRRLLATRLIAAVMALLAVGGEAAWARESEAASAVLPKTVEVKVVPQPATSSVSQCKQVLTGMPDDLEQVIRVRKALKENLHWRGAPHHVFPRKIAVQRDIDAAFSAMTEDDIPVLVNLIARAAVEKGMRGLAAGVLGRFGMRALPCIEAGIESDTGKGASDLRAVRINIEVENRSAMTPSSEQPHTDQGRGKP